MVEGRTKGEIIKGEMKGKRERERDGETGRDGD